MSNFFKTQLVLDKYKSVAKVKIVQHIVTNKKQVTTNSSTTYPRQFIAFNQSTGNWSSRAKFQLSKFSQAAVLVLPGFSFSHF